MRAIGMMSGTSMDGIDIALIETDGEGTVVRKGAGSRPYAAEVRGRLATAMVEASRIIERGDRPGSLARLEQEISTLHAQVVDDFLDAYSLSPQSIDVIGFHGQTVLHRPDEHLTVQLGDGPLLAKLTNLPVVYDLRAADVAAGGQGAPLASAYHRALASKVAQRPVAILNIGGVANITWIGADGTILAFDTGPGNALMDDWVARETGEPFDKDGALARRGSVDVQRLSTYLKHPYLHRRPPKSLDRYDFELRHLDGLSAADGAATLAQLTVITIVRSVPLLPQAPEAWVVCGGGRHNRSLMDLLARHVSAPVMRAEEIGLDGDSVEAEAWAYLAVRSIKGLPVTFPGTTGVSRPMTGGVLARP